MQNLAHVILSWLDLCWDFRLKLPLVIPANSNNPFSIIHNRGWRWILDLRSGARSKGLELEILAPFQAAVSWAGSRRFCREGHPCWTPWKGTWNASVRSYLMSGNCGKRTTVRFFKLLISFLSSSLQFRKSLLIMYFKIDAKLKMVVSCYRNGNLVFGIRRDQARYF